MKLEYKESTPLKWPDGWMRVRIQDRKSMSAWKRPIQFYRDGILRELTRLGSTRLLVTHNGLNGLDPGIAVHFSRKKQDWSWQDALGLQGVVPTIAQIDEAYRSRAMKFHPDRPGGDAKMFAALSEHRDRAKDYILGKDRMDYGHVIACDTFNEVRLNLAAIKMVITALRTFERCGASPILDRVMDISFAKALIPGVSDVEQTVAS